MEDDDSPLQDHLSKLGSSLEGGVRGDIRRSKPRLSQQRRNSVSSNGSGLQNVTDSLNVRQLESQISATRKSITNLRREIDVVKRQSQRTMRSSLNISDLETDSHHDKDVEFDFRHSRPRTYKPMFSLAFLIICLFMFVVEIGRNDWAIEELKLNPLIGPSVDVLVDLGAKDTELLQDGQVWRFFTPMILHVGLVHLLANLLGLITIGIPMEQEFGTWKIAFIAILSGMSGIALSALLAPNIVGVGASSAIFGLFGAAWGDLITNWKTYTGKNMSLTLQLGSYTAVNFAFGLMPFLDNFSHIGGFVVGLLIGSSILAKGYGDVTINRTKRIVIRFCTAILFPIALGSVLFLLFLDFDVAENCEFCEYLSCVEFPPKADTNDLWWECGPCLNGFGDFANFSQGQSVDIICPEGNTERRALSDELSEEDFIKGFMFFCQGVCG